MTGMHLQDPAPSASSLWHSFCTYMYAYCVWLWNAAVYQILHAEPAWDFVADCMACVQSSPVSIQIIVSELMDRRRQVGTAARSVGLGSISNSSVEAAADGDDAAAAKSLESLAAVSHSPAYFWVPNTLLHCPESQRVRRTLEESIGRWLPLTLASVFPNGNPPLWPARAMAKHAPHAGAPLQSLGAPHGRGSASLLKARGGVITSASLLRQQSGIPATPPPSSLLGGETGTFPNATAAAAASSPNSGGSSSSRGRHKVLALDLDETLIFASTTTASMAQAPSFSEAIPTLAGAELYHVWERPHLDLFLASMARIYNVVIFTASAAAYADPIIDRIDPARHVKRRYYRGNCVALKRQTFGTPPDTPYRCEGHEPTGGDDLPHGDGPTRYAKDLSALRVPLSHVVLLDNSPWCHSLYPSNGILVPPFHPPVHSAHTAAVRPAHAEDSVLLALIPFLEALACTTDVRSVITKATLNSSNE